MSAKRDSDRWRIEPGTKVHLDEVDPDSQEGAPGDKDETEATFESAGETVAGLQERLYAEHRQSLLIVIQAMDAGGKDGTIKHMFAAVNPQGVRVAAFKAPTPEELDHDFLWRIHHQAPRKGEIVVFNRSHYEDVLIVRVHELVPESVWRPRYELINSFETGLAAADTRIVKLYLHISKDEQAERFQARIDDPTKHWKFNVGDLGERKRWDDYMAAFEEALTQTSTEHAPWFVIPANRKWYRNWAVSRILTETLEDMDPQYPANKDDLSKVVME